MNKISIFLALVVLSSCKNSTMHAQEKNGLATENYFKDGKEFAFEEKLHFEYSVDQKELKVYNLNGDVHIEEHGGDKIIVDIIKTIKSKTQEKMEQGKASIKLGVDESQGLTLYIEEPIDTRPKDGDKNVDYDSNTWKYSFNVDYHIKLPKNFNGKIQSVNGDLIINNSTLTLEANTVNGDVKIDNAKAIGDSQTVNGDIEILAGGFLSDNIDIATINGDINLSVPKDVNAEISFESLNGEFYTDFENAEILNKVNKTVKDSNGNKSYKLNKIEGIMLGTGVSKIKCKNVNGDIFIKQI
ncbi:MAG: hypothetical protein RLZZ546_2980 [Bacteroidota bacterium]